MYATEDYVAWADELADLMGADWLAAHSARPYRDPHVIASWLEQYRNTPPELLGSVDAPRSEIAVMTTPTRRRITKDTSAK
jgi:hypothetical protein